MGALRVRVNRGVSEGSLTPPRRSERIPLICIMEMRSLYLDLDQSILGQSVQEPLSSLWEQPHCTTGEHFRQPESRGRIGFKRFSSAPPQVKLGMG